MILMVSCALQKASFLKLNIRMRCGSKLDVYKRQICRRCTTPGVWLAQDIFLFCRLTRALSTLLELHLLLTRSTSVSYTHLDVYKRQTSARHQPLSPSALSIRLIKPSFATINFDIHKLQRGLHSPHKRHQILNLRTILGI